MSREQRCEFQSMIVWNMGTGSFMTRGDTLSDALSLADAVVC